MECFRCKTTENLRIHLRKKLADGTVREYYQCKSCGAEARAKYKSSSKYAEKRTCQTCSKEFTYRAGPERGDRGRFCSVACKIEWMKGQHFSETTEFKSGVPSWNAGLTKLSPVNCKGCGESFVPKGSKIKFCSDRCFRAYNSGERHYKWLGDKVGYAGLHQWVRKTLGKPTECEQCGLSDPGRHYEWANKSGKYLRDINDWLRLCKRCHVYYDNIPERNRQRWQEKSV